MLINIKMPTVVGILTFMSMINFIISKVEHEKKFIPRVLIYRDIEMRTFYISTQVHREQSSLMNHV